MRDSSDVPHVITAYLNNCSAIVTYDSHFDAVADIIPCYAPDTLLE